MGEVKTATSYPSSPGCATVHKASRFGGTDRPHKQRNRDNFICQHGEGGSGSNSSLCARDSFCSLSSGFNANADKIGAIKHTKTLT